MHNMKILSGYIPGAIGRVAELHGTYYSRYWDFGLFFEAKVATELSEFLSRFDTTRDGFWVAEDDGKIAGSVSIDGIEGKTKGARLRWFIVDPDIQKRGTGRMLMREAVLFCKNANHSKIYLTTFAGLDPARYLYEAFGFVLCEEWEDAHRGKPVMAQYFELDLTPSLL
ncbi:MAG: GNAT family N-acetyltransferase [Desulfobacteraceae bacterium A6]|nr:MAG: GNAT family N-acetyltransferase [Desulfobacteraceae bacterium A6]